MNRVTLLVGQRVGSDLTLINFSNRRPSLNNPAYLRIDWLGIELGAGRACADKELAAVGVRAVAADGHSYNPALIGKRDGKFAVPCISGPSRPIIVRVAGLNDKRSNHTKKFFVVEKMLVGEKNEIIDGYGILTSKKVNGEAPSCSVYNGAIA